MLSRLSHSRRVAMVLSLMVIMLIICNLLLRRLVLL